MIFLESRQVIDLHDEIIEATGGEAGLLNEAALESALAAPPRRAWYGQASFAACAATYAFHLAKAHAFVDGNKRIAVVAVETFLSVNSGSVDATDDDLHRLVLASPTAPSPATPPTPGSPPASASRRRDGPPRSIPPMPTTPMQYRPLGRCGTKVSVFGLGGWTTYGGSMKDEAAVRAILHAAFEAGVNFFDAADVYARGEAERVMGKALSELPRHRLVISTKVFWPMSDDVNDRGLSRKHIMESIEKSLTRLGTDYVDIYFCHRPDPETPVEETIRAMDDLVRQGKVLYWGTSEWSGSQVHDACRLADERHLHRPQVEQPQLSLLARRKFESDLRPQCDDHGIGFVVWSPLASGLLTGKYDAGVPKGTRLDQIDWLRNQLLVPEKVERVRRMKTVADRLGCTRTQLALAWCAAQEDVSSVILGATSVKQLEENLGALAVNVDAATSAELDAIFPPDLG